MCAIQKDIVGRFRAFQGISTDSRIPGRHKLIFCIFFCIIIFLYILAGRIGVLCSFCVFLRLSAIFLKKFCGSLRIGAGDRGIHYSDLIWNVANFDNIFWNISTGKTCRTHHQIGEFFTGELHPLSDKMRNKTLNYTR